jgi:hypothetical protein
MAQIIYSNSLEVAGPWILDANALAALDKTFVEQRGKLKEYVARTRARQIEERLDDLVKLYPSETPEKRRERAEKFVGASSLEEQFSLVLQFGDGTSLSVESFAEAMKAREAKDQRVTGFRALLKAGAVRGGLDLVDRNSEIRLLVTPEAAPEARELFGSLEQWVDGTRPPRWQQLWLDFGGFAPVLWFVLFVIFGIVLDSRSSFKTEARSIVNRHVQSADVPHALEVLLGIASDASPPGNTSMPKWFIAFSLIGLIASIALVIRPKTCIAIGRGRNWVRFWRTWTKFISVTIPLTVFSSFIWPFLVNLIKKMFM